MSSRRTALRSLFLFSLSSLLVLFCLAACSGDDVKVELTGQVDRNFSAGMTICLDSSGNGICDPDEPSAVVNADGSYTVTVPAESLGNFPLVVESGNKAKGKRITLSAPADNSRFISPISTAVQNRVYQGSTQAEAEADVRQQYTLPADIDIYADYQDDSLEQEIAESLTKVADAVVTDTLPVVEAPAVSASASAEKQHKVVVRNSTSATNQITENGSSASDINAESEGTASLEEENAEADDTVSGQDATAESSRSGTKKSQINRSSTPSTGNIADTSNSESDTGSGDDGADDGNSDDSDDGDNDGNSDDFMGISAILLDVLKIEACADEGGCTVASGSMQLDLLELADGKVDFANQVLLPDNTKELRLVLGENNTITADGISSVLTVPSGSTSGLKLKGQQVFPEEGGFLTSITLDFDLEKALVSENMAGVVALPDEDATLTLGDDFSLQIPAGAVSDATIITAKEIKYFVEVKDQATGEIVRKPGLASTYELAPEGTQFTEPLRVAIRYNLVLCKT